MEINSLNTAKLTVAQLEALVGRIRASLVLIHLWDWESDCESANPHIEVPASVVWFINCEPSPGIADTVSAVLRALEAEVGESAVVIDPTA